jgi:hypothetical protein
MYPFEFKPKRGFIDQSKIFVAMPFDDKYEPIYRNLIEPAVSDVNKSRKATDRLRLYRAKDPKHTRTGWLDILENLFTARIIMGVLTGDNPNVFYELGIAHATQQIERQILIAEKGYKIKFDLKDIIHCLYDPDDIKSSKDELSTSINDTLKYYDLIKDRIVSQAEAKISRFELWVLNHFGRADHFVVDDMIGDRVFNAIAFLCHQGLLRLSAKPKGEGIINYSYYWTDLGNAVLQKLGVIDEKSRLDRSKKYWEFFDI